MEFKPGQRCEIVSVHHPVFNRYIGKRIIIAAVVDSSGTSRPTPAGAALTLTLEGQRGRRDADTWGAAADFGLAEPSRWSSKRPKCMIRHDLSTEFVDKPVRNPASVLTLEGRPY